MSSRAWRAQGKVGDEAPLTVPPHSCSAATPNPQTHLHIEKVQLDGIARIHILVGVEELPPQQKCLVLLHALFPQRAAMVQPVHWGTRLPSEPARAALCCPHPGLVLDELFFPSLLSLASYVPWV